MKEHEEGRTAGWRGREERAREVGEDGAERVVAAAAGLRVQSEGGPGVTWVLGDPPESSPTGAVKEKDRWGSGETGREAACPQLFTKGEDGGCEKTQGQEPVLGRFLLSTEGTQRRL